MMGGVGELCLSEALQLSEYSYFDPVVMSTWAGPQHWKLRPRNTKKDDTGECICTIPQLPSRQGFV